MSAVVVTAAPPVSHPFPRLALLALAAGAFVMCTAEFVIAGLLPDVAADLGVGISTAGLLISGYAAAIVVGGPVFVLAGTRVSRRRLLVFAAAVFVAGNVLSAIAGSYGLLMAGRVIGALGQGAFLATASVVAADLVTPSLRTRAIALVFAGGTAANVTGSPLGALVDSCWDGGPRSGPSPYWVLPRWRRSSPRCPRPRRPRPSRCGPDSGRSGTARYGSRLRSAWPDRAASSRPTPTSHPC